MESGKVDYREAWKLATPYMVYAVVTYTFGDVLFGLDVGSFGSIQTLPVWLAAFGEDVDGIRTLSSSRRAAMNSCVFVGKFVGTFTFEPLVERIGFKRLMFCVCAMQITGVILELATTNWIVFSTGRCLAYLAVGWVGAASPSYTADVVPAPLRGTCSGSLILFNSLGNLWGAGMGRAFATETRPVGWYVPVGVQFIPALIILALLPWTRESPRWLLSKGRKDEAIQSLNRLRRQGEVANGNTILEAEAIEQAIEFSRRQAEGRWIDLFRGTYFRRTMVATWTFIFQQITAQQFIGSYGPTFYRQFNLQERAFTFQVITIAVTVIACAFTLPLYDKYGRRQINIVGSFLQVPFMGLVAGFGTQAATTGTLTSGATAGMVVGMVGANAAVKISLSTLAYVFGPEAGGTLMRKKVFAFALCIDVIAAFGVNFSVPYLLGSPGANLGGRIGWLFFVYCVASFVFITLFLPELKGRSLEEADELFEMRLWAWQFGRAQTKGVGARIGRLEGAHEPGQAEMGDQKGEYGQLMGSGQPSGQTDKADEATVEHIELSQRA